MDPVLTPVIVAAGVSGGIEVAAATATTAAVTVSYASLISAAIVTTGAVGAAYALSPEDQKQKIKGEQIVVKQSTPARVRGYGTTKLGGATFILADSYQYLYIGVVHAEGPIDSFRE